MNPPMNDPLVWLCLAALPVLALVKLKLYCTANGVGPQFLQARRAIAWVDLAALPGSLQREVATLDPELRRLGLEPVGATRVRRHFVTIFTHHWATADRTVYLDAGRFRMYGVPIPMSERALTTLLSSGSVLQTSSKATLPPQLRNAANYGFEVVTAGTDDVTEMLAEHTAAIAARAERGMQPVAIGEDRLLPFTDSQLNRLDRLMADDDSPIHATFEPSAYSDERAEPLAA